MRSDDSDKPPMAREEPGEAFDDVLDEFINRPIVFPDDHTSKIIKVLYHENGKIQEVVRGDGTTDYILEYYENGKLKSGTKRKKYIRKFISYYDNGMLEKAFLRDDKNICRQKLYAPNGQLTRYEYHKISKKGWEKTYKSLEWYDNGNLKSEVKDTHKPKCGKKVDNDKIIECDKKVDIERENIEDIEFEIKINCDSVYYLLCEYVREGKLEALKLVKQKFPNMVINNNEIIKIAVEYNKTSILKYLREEYGLTANDARDHNNYALRFAVKNGYASILKELREGYGLTVEDVRADRNYALRCAALNKQLCSLMELKEYGLNVSDAHMNNNEAIRLICCSNPSNYIPYSDNRYVCLKFMREGFGLTADDARAMDNYILRYLFKRGTGVDILKELREGYGLGAEDARTQNNYAFRWAVKNNCCLDILIQLKQFGLTAEDVRSDNSIIQHAAKSSFSESHKYDKPSQKLLSNLKAGNYGFMGRLKQVFELKDEDFKCVDWKSVINSEFPLLEKLM